MPQAAGQPEPRRNPRIKGLTEEETAELLQELLARHVNQLSEHFSSVQIIATKLESDGGTRRFDEGSGDMFARQGAARRWLLMQEPHHSA